MQPSDESKRKLGWNNPDATQTDKEPPAVIGIYMKDLISHLTVQRYSETRTKQSQCNK